MINDIKDSGSENRRSASALMLRSSILPAVLLLLLLIQLSSALSPLGGSCKLSGDCREGFCQDSRCSFPPVLEKFTVNGSCNLTADCLGGFCRNNECITPLREEFTLFSAGAGIKSACAGFIQNCTGIFCTICDTGWILLIVGAGVAAFVSRKRGRLLPAIMLGVPLLAGLVVFPILGFLLSLIEIAILTVLKSKSEESVKALKRTSKPRKQDQ